MTNQKLLAVSIEFVTCSFIFTLAFSYMYLLVLNFFFGSKCIYCPNYSRANSSQCVLVKYGAADNSPVYM
jgi:hypothetical protein